MSINGFVDAKKSVLKREVEFHSIAVGSEHINVLNFTLRSERYRFYRVDAKIADSNEQLTVGIHAAVHINLFVSDEIYGETVIFGEQANHLRLSRFGQKSKLGIGFIINEIYLCFASFSQKIINDRPERLKLRIV